MKVLIVGTRSPYALELIRIFKNHEVYALDFFDSALGNYSCYVRKSFTITAPNTHFVNFSNEFSKLYLTHKFDLIIPCNEEVFHFAKLKEDYPLFCPDIETLRQIHHKYEFIQLLEEKNIAAPQTNLLSKGLPPHSIVKRIYSRFGCYVYDNDSVPHISDPENWIAQEKLAGTEVCIYTIVIKGKITAKVAYKKEYTINNGAAIFFEAYHHLAIDKFLDKFFVGMDTSGQFSFDGFLTDRGFIPIECNPRATSGIHLFDESLANAFFDQQAKVRLKPRPQMLMLAMLIYGWGNKNFIRDFWQASDVIYDRKDKFPFLMQWKSLGYFLKLQIKHKKPLVACMTLDIEFNG